LGRQQVIAGQEDQIIATAQLLSKTASSCPPLQDF